jgi:hypothetical protein
VARSWIIVGRISNDLYVNVSLSAKAVNVASYEDKDNGEGKHCWIQHCGVLQTAESTKGSLGSPSRFLCMLFSYYLGGLLLFLATKPVTAVSDPIQGQEQTYFFER